MTTSWHIGFICSGNICRSPYAEGLLRHLAREKGWGDRLRVSSAGTLGIDDAPADTLTLALAAERGFQLLSHRSRGVSRPYLENCDVVLCMGRSHVEGLREEFPELGARIYLLGSYPHLHLDGDPIPDPVGREVEVFLEVHAAIESALQPVLVDLRRRFSLDPDPRAGD
ncbi:MAG: hypothetical protein KDC38_05325 [Planctomycetes bacterium]|nr:hypothetical protein [Planctomycetota bacterium]